MKISQSVLKHFVKSKADYWHYWISKLISYYLSGHATATEIARLLAMQCNTPHYLKDPHKLIDRLQKHNQTFYKRGQHNNELAIYTISDDTLIKSLASSHSITDATRDYFTVDNKCLDSKASFIQAIVIGTFHYHQRITCASVAQLLNLSISYVKDITRHHANPSGLDHDHNNQGLSIPAPEDYKYFPGINLQTLKPVCAHRKAPFRRPALP